MTIFRIFVLAAVVLFPVHARGEGAEIRVVQAPSSLASREASYPAREAVEEALATFMRMCAPLTTDYWADVASATATVFNETYSKARLDRYGWRREIAIAILIKDHPTVIPRKFDVASHTLHFALGGGASPGIVASKTAQALCGMGAPGREDVFRSVPELAVIDR